MKSFGLIRNISCQTCGKDKLLSFSPSNVKIKGFGTYCSDVCRLKSRRKLPYIYNCLVCCKEKDVRGGQLYKFCSRKCYWRRLKGKTVLSGTTFQLGQEPIKHKKNCVCFRCSPLKGEKNRSWKGGITSKNQKLRNSREYRQWRSSVFRSDNWTCQDCGIRGVYLNADHIKPWCYFPELRFELSNGRTLCKDCHKKTDTFGWKMQTYQLKPSA